MIIEAEKIHVGIGSYISPSASIRGLNGKAKSIYIGDNVYIGDSVQIIVDGLSIGDYSKVHNHCTLHGYKPLSIGHNAWIGQGTIIDSIGGTTIGNNFGVGAYSQLWSHIRHGDPLLGCNYNGSKELVIGNDVWLVGHCIVSPITIEDRAMALVGSVVTKDMKSDRVYAGAPAKDITEKMLPQFSITTPQERFEMLLRIDRPKNIDIVLEFPSDPNPTISYFNATTRTYTKNGTEEEIAFMKHLHSNLIKFTPE